jgi:hypothetical protein
MLFKKKLKKKHLNKMNEKFNLDSHKRNTRKVSTQLYLNYLKRSVKLKDCITESELSTNS